MDYFKFAVDNARAQFVPDRMLDMPEGRVLTDAEENMVEAALSERARDEFQSQAQVAVDYLVNECDTSDLASIVMLLAKGTPDSCDEAKRKAEQMIADYVQDRVATADADERAEIEQEALAHDTED